MSVIFGLVVATVFVPFTGAGRTMDDDPHHAFAPQAWLDIQSMF